MRTAGLIIRCMNRYALRIQDLLKQYRPEIYYTDDKDRAI